MDWFLSTANPFTPSLCPPAESGSGKTTSRRSVISSCVRLYSEDLSNLAQRTIAYLLLCLASHPGCKARYLTYLTLLLLLSSPPASAAEHVVSDRRKSPRGCLVAMPGKTKILLLKGMLERVLSHRKIESVSFLLRSYLDSGAGGRADGQQQDHHRQASPRSLGPHMASLHANEQRDGWTCSGLPCALTQYRARYSPPLAAGGRGGDWVWGIRTSPRYCMPSTATVQSELDIGTFRLAMAPCIYNLR